MSQDGAMDYDRERVAQPEQATEAEAQAEKADRVVAPATATSMLSGKGLASVQRQALIKNVMQNFGNREVQRMLGTVRRSAAAGPEGGQLENDVADRIQAARSGGQPMDTSVRREVEGKLGQDLSPVRVHTGSESAQLNREVGAKAFTIGRDIFYGEGTSPSDMELTTHEATHTIQQGFSEDKPASVGAADTAQEHEAHSNATSSSAMGVQRETAGEEEEVARMSIQREGMEEEEGVQRAIQREGMEEEEGVQREIQREGEEEEEGVQREIQREGEEEEEMG